MANNVNLITLKAGDIVRMADGGNVKILQNPGDGVWVFGFYVTDAKAPGEDGPEEPIFAQEIEELIYSAE